MALVEQGRTIYQRILTWIINKISRTILKAAFVAITFVVTGKFVLSAFAMLLLVFMTDFAKIALANDHVRPSKQTETWSIGGFMIVAEALTGPILTRVGLPGLMPLPWSQTLAIFACALVSCLRVNEAFKIAMIKWRARRGRLGYCQHFTVPGG